ncbi:tyrosine-type recombinase/integrase [Micromonospora sp. DT4]|uniref:tyrosine-type recombinase/integrase n=1 Tax=Micromonospora sp. DT4 TaxID=3393438 RepID=UPI003CE9433C
MAEFRAFTVRLPTGVRYWTVIDDQYRVVAAADEFLLHLRLGRDRAESTTQAYATGLALFFAWCAASGADWTVAAPRLGRFMHWLGYFSKNGGGGLPVVGCRVRGAGRVNAVLAAVREFLKHAVSVGAAAPGVLDGLYEVVEDWDLPAEVRGEGRIGLRSRPRHRLREPQRAVEAATDEQVLALLRACHRSRDRFIVLALWRMGLRRGELIGLRREDVHFVPDATRLCCGVRGAHAHVVRRDNRNGAAAKSRRSRAVPADWLVVQAYDQYLAERIACPEADRCDFVLVNLFGQPLGAPMRPQALNELLEALSRRARLTRPVHPHALRHSFGTNLAASGATLDEIKDLLGHAAFTSSEVYLHPSQGRLREAVGRVALPRVARPVVR